jgi:hypothetical protein
MFFIKKNNLLLFFLIFFSCSSSISRPKLDFKSSYNLLINQYGNTHFFGVGNASSPTQQLAIKIAKTKALGDLADNIKVTILSKLEIVSSEIKIDDKTQMSELIKENIISLGNATVKYPEYDIQDVTFSDDQYNVIVIAKKLKKEHIEESALDLELLDSNRLLILLQQ